MLPLTSDRTDLRSGTGAGNPILTSMSQPTTVAELLRRAPTTTARPSSSTTGPGRTGSSSTRAGGGPRCSPSSATRTGRPTSACCSTTCPTTSSGWPPPRCRARSSSASTRPTGATSSAQLDRPHRLPGARDLDRRSPAAARRRRHRRARRPGPRRRRARPTPSAWPRSRSPAAPDRRRRGRPVPADLHVGIDRAAQGGALHAGPVRPHRRPRRRDRRARRRRRGLRAAPVLPLRARCSPGWASALHAGVPIATRPRFSASGTLPDIRRFGATMLTYTGKVLNYILATPEQPDDADIPLRLAIGNEASRARHPRRSPAGSAATCATATARPRASSSSAATRRCPPARSGTADRHGEGARPRDRRGVPAGRVRRPTAGSSTSTRPSARSSRPQPASGFEGYYRNEAATQERFRDGCYWSGDLAYRDADGWLYFAGRSNEWLRVDGENFAAAPVEAIVARHPDVRSVAVYAVPDDPVGDRVMVALELRDGADVRPGGVRRVPRRPARPRPEVGPRLRPGRRRAAEARQHEARQDAACAATLAGRRASSGGPARARSCGRSPWTTVAARPTGAVTEPRPRAADPRRGPRTRSDATRRPDVSRDRAGGGARAPARASQTRARLLEAAKEVFEETGLPRGPHLRHRRAGRALARVLLPLLRFEGADLPRGRRGAGGPAHRAARRRGRRPTAAS